MNASRSWALDARAVLIGQRDTGAGDEPEQHVTQAFDLAFELAALEDPLRERGKVALPSVCRSMTNASSAFRMGSRNASWMMVTSPVMANLAIAHQAEGMTVQRLQERSAEMGGHSMDEWRKEVLGKLQKGDESMQSAAKFLSDRNWTGATPGKPADPSAFQQLIGQQGYSTAKNDLPSSLGMMKYLGKDLIYDTGWQPRTSVSYVTRYTGADKKAGAIPDGKEIGDVKTEAFTNPEEEPGIVARGGVKAGLGSFVRIGDSTNPLRYARVIDGKPGGSPAAEINIAAGQNAGNTSFDPNAASGSTDVNVVSAHPKGRTDGLELPLDAKLNNENTQYAGYLADVKKEPYDKIATQSELTKTMDRYKNDAAFKKYQTDVKAALDKQKKALEKAKQDAIEKRIQAGGGDRVEKGVAGVFGGKEMREIVTVTSPTQSGDALLEGRYGTYAGMQRYPVSTLGSLTVQSQAVVTALDDVFVFGATTSMPA